MKIAYFVHNIDDAAVRKRVTMLTLGGGQARLIGFSRFTQSAGPENGSGAYVIGQSSDGKFFKRILVVLRCILWPFGLIGIVKPSDAILCRNLEMLALGYAIKVLAGSRAPLTYECLDIHGKLLGSGLQARVLRRIELFLMNRCHTVITSSPGFIRHYFHAVQNFQGPICLMENKVMAPVSHAELPEPGRQPGWTIGWFGIIRCRKSLDMLDRLSKALPSVRVVISGRIAYQEFDDFDATVAANPNLSYTGPFQPEDLPEVYGQAHFVWAIDYYEEGENSNWLLPNRLYDSLAFGAVPIALEHVETGQWLRTRQAGVVISSPLEDLRFLEDFTESDFSALKENIKSIDRGDIIHNSASITDLMHAVTLSR